MKDARSDAGIARDRSSARMRRELRSYFVNTGFALMALPTPSLVIVVLAPPTWRRAAGTG